MTFWREEKRLRTDHFLVLLVKNIMLDKIGEYFLIGTAIFTVNRGIDRYTVQWYRSMESNRNGRLKLVFSGSLSSVSLPAKKSPHGNELDSITYAHRRLEWSSGRLNGLRLQVALAESNIGERNWNHTWSCSSSSVCEIGNAVVVEAWDGGGVPSFNFEMMALPDSPPSSKREWKVESQRHINLHVDLAR